VVDVMVLTFKRFLVFWFPILLVLCVSVFLGARYQLESLIMQVVVGLFFTFWLWVCGWSGYFKKEDNLN